MKEKFNDRKAKGYVTIFEAYDQLGLRLDLNRLLSISDPKELWWAYGKDDMIDFGAKVNKDSGIIELDFNIGID